MLARVFTIRWVKDTNIRGIMVILLSCFTLSFIADTGKSRTSLDIGIGIALLELSAKFTVWNSLPKFQEI
jgi:hypothetical protein